MIIDINSYIGHWPFRQLKNNTAAGLVKLMKESGIDMAAVSSVNAIFYKDTQQGNEELAEEINGHGGKFIPFAIINPAYTGWKKDFLYCVEKLGMKGLELYPYYHQYSLADKNTVELLNIAADMKIPVHLPCAIENLRQRHWMDTTRNLSVGELEKVLPICPGTDFIITNGSAVSMARQLQNAAEKRPGKIYYDFARLDVFTSGLETLVNIVGADRIVFGSVMPFQYIDTQLVKLHYSKLSETDKNKIAYGNISLLFGL